MTLMNKRLLLVLLIAAAAISPLHADDNRYRVSLAFIGPADALYSWWGHVAVIIEDNVSGAKRYYDYGNFSFSQDSFIRNFVMGRLYFLKIVSNPDPQLKYSAYLNRDVTVYELNIQTKKAAELAAFLENEVRPENRVYLYDHFYDNCSTRIRDMMDEVTDGALKQSSSEEDLTLRQQLRRFTYSFHFMDWLLNFAINGSVDKPATEWEGMFLPEQLEEGIAKVMITDDNGDTVPFVKSKTILNRAEGRTEIPDIPPAQWPLGLAIGLVLAAAAFFLKRNSSLGLPAKKGYAIYSVVLALLIAVPGSLLFFMAFFTDHTCTYRNMNLLYANPFPIVTAVYSVGMLTKKNVSSKAVEICWTVTIAGGIIAVILNIVPPLRQANLMSLLMILPAAAVQSLLYRKVIKL